MQRRKYSSSLAFNDLLFNVLIGFVILFIITFLLINPITKKNDIPQKAEFMLMLEWDDQSKDDLDIWVKADGQQPVSFKGKGRGLWHLDRDDLGTKNDIAIVDGEPVTLFVNREVATMRGIQPGNVMVNVHVYTKRLSDPVVFKITLLKINPYREIYVRQELALEQNQVFVMPAFTVDSEGNITDVYNSDVRFAASRVEGNSTWETGRETGR